METRLAFRVRSECRLSKFVDDGKLQVYKLPVKSVSTHDGAKSIIRRYAFGDGAQKRNFKPTKTILLMGATGSGKTTMINAMINYILGVEWQDPFRFILIDEKLRGNSQAFSQTQQVTAYDINHREGFRIPFSLTIVDTPGFGDTEGASRDREITLAVTELFENQNGIQELNALAFVVQSPMARLTPSQMYIFNSVLSIFGNEIGENVLFLTTFADGRRPVVLDAIQAADLTCRKDDKGVPYHQKFNNVAVFTNNHDPEDQRSPIEWASCMKSFGAFFSELSKMHSLSLRSIREVLQKKERLNSEVAILKDLIVTCLNEMEKLKKQSLNLKTEILNHELMVDACKDFEIKVKVLKRMKIRIQQDTALNCNTCEVTCHYPCDSFCPFCPAFWPTPISGIASMIFPIFFMGVNDNCKVCPRECSRRHHVNERERWSNEEVEEVQTLYDKHDRYEYHSRKLLDAKELSETIDDQLEELEDDFMHMIHDVIGCVNELRKMSQQEDLLSTSDYLNQMIESESREGKPGYEERIQILRHLRMSCILRRLWM